MPSVLCRTPSPFALTGRRPSTCVCADGYELENVFVDQLFDDAEAAAVPEGEWEVPAGIELEPR